VEREDETIESFVQIPWVLTKHSLDAEVAKDLRLVVTELDDLYGATQLEPGNSPEAMLSDARTLLWERQREWEKTKNPVVAIEACIIAYKGGLYPPLWALSFLIDGLERWHDQNGHITIDQAIGARAKGKGGRTPAFKSAIKHQRDQIIRQSVWRLRHVFNISLEQAAEMEWRRMDEDNRKNHGLDKSGWGFTVLDVGTIENIAMEDPFKDTDGAIDKLKSWNEQNKAALLRCYPGGIPPKRKFD